MTSNEYGMPDDLIRAKEWQALSPEERAWLKEIAASEEEYNLLRRMLHTAAVQPGLAQGPGPEVEEQLKNAFAAEKKRRGMVVIWRYAAAAAILVAVAGYVFWQIQPGKPAGEDLAGNTPRKETPVTAAETKTAPAATAPVTAMTDTAATIPSFKEDPSRPQDTAGTGHKEELSKMTADMPPPAPAPQTATGQVMDMETTFEKKPSALPAISARVKDNEGLAGLVAAVY